MAEKHGIVDVSVFFKDGSPLCVFRVDLVKYRTREEQSDKELLIRGLTEKKPAFSKFFENEACSYTFCDEEQISIELGFTSPITSRKLRYTLPVDKEDFYLSDSLEINTMGDSTFFNNIPDTSSPFQRQKEGLLVNVNLTNKDKPLFQATKSLKNQLESPLPFQLVPSNNLLPAEPADILLTRSKTTITGDASTCSDLGLGYIPAAGPSEVSQASLGQLSLMHRGAMSSAPPPNKRMTKSHTAAAKAHSEAVATPVISINSLNESSSTGKETELLEGVLPMDDEESSLSEREEELSQKRRSTRMDSCTTPKSSKKTPLKRKKLICPQDRSFVRTSFKLPKSFRLDIDETLLNQKSLKATQESFVCRVLAHRITKQTLGPYRSDLKWVIEKFIEQFPHLVFNNAREATIDAWVTKLGDCIARMRGDLGLVLVEIGRPPKKTKSQVVLHSAENSKGFDEASYYENVEKMNDVFIKTPSSIRELELLQDLTFEARRLLFTRTGKHLKWDGVEIILRKHCLLFKELPYLFRELDKILGAGTCEAFRNSWCARVPKIISMAKTKKSKVIKKVLCDLYSYSKELLAIALLPHLIGSDINNVSTSKNSKKGPIEHTTYFFHELDRVADIAKVTKNGEKSKPFLAAIGGVIHIVVEGETMYKIQDSPTEALLTLMAVHYVFDLQYEEAVRSTLWYIQKYLLNSTCEEINRCHRVRKFHLELENVEILSSSSPSSDDY